MNETGKGVFPYAVHNIQEIYVASEIISCMVGFETPTDIHSNSTVMIIV
jgi:hypothetical protein